jgi:glycosyltransferase involved in cell wall biosynthesis
MSSLPLVSIMIPTFNQAGFLQAAIQSALGQDYGNLEVVVSDDCSGDGSREVVEGFLSDSRIRYFRNDSNLGRVANYKHSLENLAQGEWVTNLDADDYYTDRSFISRAINLITQYGDKHIVFLQAGHTVMTGSGEVKRIDVPAISLEHERVPGIEYFLRFNHFSHLATLFNREKAIALDFYRYNILSSDIESFLRLALHGDVILMRESVGVWQHHGSNASKQLDKKAVEMNMMRIESPYNYARSLGTIPQQNLSRWHRKMTNEYLLHYLSISLSRKEMLPGYFSQVCRRYPRVLAGWIIPKAVSRAVISRIKGLVGQINKG